MEDKLLPSCNLTDKDQRSRSEKMKREVFQRAVSIKELKDGYDLIFKEPIAFANQLLEMINFERECCPYFTWGLVFEPHNRATHLQVYGSKSIKEELRMWLSEMRLIK